MKLILFFFILSHFFIHLTCCHVSSLSTREPGVWALERAKQNVLENYLLVGILEELEDVLLLLERLLPHYFSGVLNIYKSPGTYHLSSCHILLIDSLSAKFVLLFLQTIEKWGT